MTITTEDRKRYQTTVGNFQRQENENTCLSRTLENAISELSSRHNLPELRLSHDQIKEICDYKPDWGCDTSLLPEVLTSVFVDLGYSCQLETGIDLNELDSIINQERSSYPIVELSPEYLHDQDGYDVRAGMYGRAIPHTVVVFTVNDENVQFFDPYQDYYSPPETGGAPPSEIPKSRFIHYWSGREEYRWTLWIRREQQTLLRQTSFSSKE